MGQQISSQMLRDIWGKEDVRDVSHLSSCLEKAAKKSKFKTGDVKQRIHECCAPYRRPTKGGAQSVSFAQFEAQYVQVFAEELKKKEEEQDLSVSVAAMLVHDDDDDAQDQVKVKEEKEEISLPQAQDEEDDDEVIEAPSAAHHEPTYVSTPAPELSQDGQCLGVCCKDGKKNYTDFKGNLSGSEDADVTKAIEVVKFCAPDRSYKEIRVKKNGITLYVQYGRRKSDWINVGGEWGSHNPRWEAEKGAPLEKYIIDPAATHSQFRELLEAVNNMDIYFHRWDYGNTMGKVFQDGEIVQTERQPWRKYD